MNKAIINKILFIATFFTLSVFADSFFMTLDASDSMSAETGSSMPWWFWPLSLFIVSFLLGIVAVLGGGWRSCPFCAYCRRLFPVSS